MGAPMRILFVEDEPRVAAIVERGLAEHGYVVEWVKLGSRGLQMALSEPFDLILLDVRLPDISGIEVCRRIRTNDPQIPILMLTALDSVDDRVTGLTAGADDYLPKPFAFEELLARIAALMRRASAAADPGGAADGPLVLDPIARTCTCDGDGVDLTRKEFDLLAYFVARKGHVLSRDDIHRDVWGNTFDRGTNLIDVYVGYIRKKLADQGYNAGIQSIRGIGYRFDGTSPLDG
jgi:two-component system OmpR family response regulator/two-component system response regulator MprA